MPPKNKKQLQEEAKRLQEQQRKRQQQQRRLQQQRKKYAAQTLNTGLVLPVSNQLLTQFSTHSLASIQQKLFNSLQNSYSTLNNPKLLKQLLKQLAYVIKNSKKIFQLPSNCCYEGNQSAYLKVRILCGMFVKIFLNDHSLLSEQNLRNNNKNIQTDSNLLKQLLANHSLSKKQTQIKVFQRKQVIQVLQFFKINYFNHFLVLHKTTNFPKRQDQKSFNLYISSSWIQNNNSSTVFVDLSGHKNEQKEMKIQS